MAIKMGKRIHLPQIVMFAWGLWAAFILGGCAGETAPSEAVEQGAEPLAAGTILQVSPPTASIPANVQRQFLATLVRPHNWPKTLLAGAAWTVSDATVATVDSTGFVTGLRPGSITVTAAYQGLTATSKLTVTAATLTSIDLDPPTRKIQIGTHAVFRAMGAFNDDTTFPLRGAVTWTSTAPAVATVDSTGRATGVAAGIAAIEAISTATGLTAKAFLTVGSASLRSLAIGPPNSSTTPGSSVPFVVTGTFTDHSTQDLTDTATWSSSSPSVATISNTSGSQGVATAAGIGTTTLKAVVGHRTATAQLTVTRAALTSIAITPATDSIPNGMTSQLVATGTYSDHITQNITGLVTWTSSSSAVFVSNATGSSGLAMAMELGTATVTATDASGIHATATLTVTAAVLKALSVTPPMVTVALGLPQQFLATGTFTDSTTRDLTGNVKWTSTSPLVGTVSSVGLASTLSTGTTTVGARDPTSGLTASASLTVSPAALESIAITPSSASIANGLTEQFAATGTYSDGSHQDLTSVISWSVPTGTVVMSNTGLATSNGVGTSAIQAADGAVTGTATLNVTAATIVSIQVTPAVPSLPLGTTQQFAATAIFTDSSTKDVTGAVTWSSTNINSGNADATISNVLGSNGFATANAPGTTTITATYPPSGPSGSTILTVTPAALVSIAVTPPSPSLPVGTAQQFAATGTYTDGTTKDLSGSVSWLSSVPSVFAVSAAAGSIGLGSALTPGSATLSATYLANPTPIVGSTAVTVNPAVLVSIAILPAAPNVALGRTQQFVAMGAYSDGSTTDVTTAVTWTSGDTSIAIVSNAGGTNGVATSKAVGVTPIGATLGSVSNTATLTVTAAVLVSVAVTPSAQAVPSGLTQQFTATGTYSDGTAQLLTSGATWSSSGPSATISNAFGSQGLATGGALGTATIAALVGGTSIQGTATMTTTAAVLKSVQVTPATPGVQVGQTTQLAATGAYSDGSPLDITSSVTWTSSDTTIASVSNASGSKGLATGIAVGTATITATDAATGNSASAMVAVFAAGSFVAVVGPGGGTVGTISNGTGISMKIPAGALRQTLTITVTPVATPVGGAFAPIYEIGPSGTRFAAPVTLTFPYSTTELGGHAPTDFAVSTVVAGIWQATSAPVLDTAAGTISGVTTHLSPFTLAPLEQCPPLGPAPASTTLTPAANGGIWDFYSYHFVADAPNADNIYGEIIFYGLGCNLGASCTPTSYYPPVIWPGCSGPGSCSVPLPSTGGGCNGGSACGPTFGIAGISVGSTSPLGFNATGADLLYVSTVGTSWNGSQITAIDLGLGLSNDISHNPNDVIVQQDSAVSGTIIGPDALLWPRATGTWQFKTHWQSPTWLYGPHRPPSTPPLPQPTPPFATPAQGEFNDPPSTPPPNVCCSDGSTSCSGVCGIDITSDPSNCGACGNTCAAGSFCVSGICVLPGQSLCSNGPTDTQTDSNNCGACGTACNSGYACTAGSCVCLSPNSQCRTATGSVCASLQTDSTNCGTCGNACPQFGAADCISGACACRSSTDTLCGAGTASPYCTDLNADPRSCGGCGAACPQQGQVCKSGTCVACAQTSDCLTAYGGIVACCSGGAEVLQGSSGGGTCVSATSTQPPSVICASGSGGPRCLIPNTKCRTGPQCCSGVCGTGSSPPVCM